MANVSVLSVGLAGTGLVFVWSAVHGANLSSTLRDLLSGHVPAAPAADPALLPAASNDSGGTSTMGKTPTGNQQIGQMLAAGYGWGSGGQWDALVKLWNRESGWNNTAENPSSGAYGIAQALPYSKMPQSAWPPRYGGSADSTAQIQWGLSYIKSRYGDPISAWAHETSAGWY